MTEAFERAIQTRIRAIAGTPEKTRKALAQHLTPPEVASLAVSMFGEADDELKCLDLGGGTGILSIALLERYGEQVGRLDTIEMDPTLARIYDDEVRMRVGGTTTIGDAIAEGVGDGTLYDRIILNPPYKKMASDDLRQGKLPEVLHKPLGSLRAGHLGVVHERRDVVYRVVEAEPDGRELADRVTERVDVVEDAEIGGNLATRRRGPGTDADVLNRLDKPLSLPCDGEGEHAKVNYHRLIAPEGAV
jgi:predicted RNA methylase